MTFIFFISKKRKQTAPESKVIHKEQSVIFLFYYKIYYKTLCIPETSIDMRKNTRLLLTLHASFIDATRVFY